MKRRSTSPLRWALKPLLVFGFTVLILLGLGLPILYAVLWSLVNPEYPWSYGNILPQHVSLYQWRYVFEHTTIVQSIANSFLIAAVSTLCCFFLALPTAYALGRRNLKGKEVFKVIMLLPMVFPGMAMGLFLGRTLYSLGLSGTYLGVVMAHILAGLPYMLRILVVNFESMPQDLVDAAENLGAGSWHKFWEVYLPMILPGLVAGSIFTFITSMEEFNLTFIIGAPDITTIPTVLYSYLGENFLRTRASVVSLIMLIPNLVLLLITEHRIKAEYMGAALGKM
ncbi:ABC transporter permease [Butyricicoccus sp. 1XD8-22]|nr:ABC transporter permease [Butyricicoccus sp. 1XD8-22]